MKQLCGDWDSSFNNLFSFKAQVESSCPGSKVIIDHYIVNGEFRFRRFFFAMKPCIDGFLNGCRPYLAIDSTFLTGKFKGNWIVLVQLMDIVGCILFVLEFLIPKLMTIGSGS